MNKNEKAAKIKFAASMLIFGTILIFKRKIDLPASILAMARGVLGFAFLWLVITIKNQKLNIEALKKNFLYLILSGTFIGFNWILLFESSEYTSVAVSTLCYYMAPVIVIIFSPLILREKLEIYKVFCVCIALLGMVFVSGVIDEGIQSASEIKGVLLGLGAAVLYASVIMLNKKITDISSYDKTIYQLGIAGFVLIPYTLVSEDYSAINFEFNNVILILIVCVVHTGITYYLYFGSLSVLSAQTASLYSYIDPAFAIFLSIFLLDESFGFFKVLGMILIFGSTIFCELYPILKNKNKGGL